MTADGVEPLSKRELELVRLLAGGLSNREIAQKLHISPNTVKVHLRNIYAKLQVSSRTEAMMVALRMGWVELDGIEEKPQETAETAQEPVPAADVPVALARWKHVYLVVVALLIGLGLWLIWPRHVKLSAPFTDLRASAPSWVPGQVSRWETLAQMPTPRSRLALVAYGGRVYAIGGETATGVSDEVDIYLPDADDWVRGPAKTTAVANVGATAWDGKIYVPGGSLANGEMSERLEILDLDSASWRTGSALPHGLCAYASVAYQDQLYLFGGWDGVSYLSQSFRYDPTSDTWETRSPMPAARAFAGAGVIGERIYVVGGYDGQNELDLCQVYDPQTDAWDTCPPMSAPRGGLNVAVIADSLYAIGGGWNSYLVENERFSPDAANPAQGTWQTFPSPMLQEWRNLGVVSANATLYAIGGWDGEYLGVNQAYRVLYRLYLPSAIGSGGGAAE